METDERDVLQQERVERLLLAEMARVGTNDTPHEIINAVKLYLEFIEKQDK